MSNVSYKLRGKMINKLVNEYPIEEELVIKYMTLTGDDHETLRNACEEYCKRKAADYSQDGLDFVMDRLRYGNFNNNF